MNDDRTLLERAAKAAGRQIRWDGNVAVLLDFEPGVDDCSAWHPLTDDGDALRLAVKLSLQIAPDPANSMVCAWLADESDAEPIEGTIMVELWKDSDPYAATRRAIVRAAAALGA